MTYLDGIDNGNEAHADTVSDLQACCCILADKKPPRRANQGVLPFLQGS